MEVFGEEFLFLPPRIKAVPTDRWNWRPVHPSWLDNEHPFAVDGSVVAHGRGKAKILVIGRKSAQSGAIIQMLKEKNRAFLAVDWDEFIYAGQLIGSLGTGRERLQLKFSGKVHDLSSVCSIYYAEPLSVEALYDTGTQFKSDETLFLSRWRETIFTLKNLVPKAKWFPGPPMELLEDRQRKLADLRQAKDWGLKVPPTLVTNSPKEARSFVKRHNGQVIFREFGLRRLKIRTTWKAFRVDFVDPKSKHWSKISESPVVLQKYVQKKADIRLYVIDNKVLACRIDSQSSSKTKLDWRNYDNKHVAYHPIAVPSNMAKACRNLCKQGGLRFAGFDFVEDLRGNWVFLEMNRPGSWLFMEALAGVPLRESITQALLSDLK